MAHSSHLEKVTGQRQQEILDLVTAWITQQSGKGPVRTNVQFHGSIVAIEMYGLSNPMGKPLPSEGGCDLDQRYRGTLRNIETDGWGGELYRRLGLKVGRISGSFDQEKDVRTVNIHLDGFAATKG